MSKKRNNYNNVGINRVYSELSIIKDSNNLKEVNVENNMSTNIKKISEELELIKEKINKFENDNIEIEDLNKISNGIRTLKGYYKSYQAYYDDVVSKIENIKNANENSNNWLKQIQNSKNTVDEISKDIQEKFGLIVETINNNTDFVEEIESANENINEISSLYDQALKQKNEISKVYFEIFGRNKKNEETGEIEHISGLKESLDSAYEALESKLSNLEIKTEEKYNNQIGKWQKDYDLVKDKIDKLLPGAMTTGLAFAYAEKREKETNSYNFGYAVFIFIIIAMISLSFIPVHFIINKLGEGKDFVYVLKNIPIITISMLPLYGALIWLGIFQNKKLNLSKKLIEEYSHKENTAKTFEGLSKQISEIGEDEISNKLKIRLLEQTLDASAKNPAECITNQEKSDNPMISILNMPLKWVKLIGEDKVSNILTILAKSYKSNINKPSEIVDIEEDKI